MGGASDLVKEIVAGGALTDPAWRAAFAEVRRELFVPYYYTVSPGGARERLWRDDPDPRRRERWREGVYDDVPLATRMRDGELISSSSQPSLMARMLEALEAGDGMSVLEIGTGPGYNAALLSHRLGDSRVTTMDLDPDITEAARAHLAAAGYRPRVVTGNGARGCPAHAPYDRIIATCALPRVPEAWPEQCAPGALVLAPIATGLLRLRVTGTRYATGRFLETPAFFVPLRGGGPATPTGQAAAAATEPGAPTERTEPTAGGPSGSGASGEEDQAEGRDAEEAEIPRRVLRDDSFRFLLTLSGGSLDRPRAYALWRRAGRPARERYGVTLRDGAQWAWLDDEDGPDTWPLGEQPTARSRD
ncbi:methyltransferase domain-containing protein [Streptomyces sp. NPDC054796]